MFKVHRKLVLLVCCGLYASAVTAQPFERTEKREPCQHYLPTKMPLFGDLHVHTRYSFDSYISSQRNDPWDAYRYAKGEAIMLSDPDSEQTLRAQLRRPLDFAGITDHAEYLGPISICTEDAGKAGYWLPYCVLTRSETFILQLLAANYWVNLTFDGDNNGRKTSLACKLSDCDAAHREVWGRIQQAAEDHYDRSGACSFTSFVAYEYTDTPNGNNLHRNVVFRNGQVTETAISTYDTGSYNYPELWRQLRHQCIEAGAGCDVLAIPHNPNLSGGLMFRDPETPGKPRSGCFSNPWWNWCSTRPPRNAALTDCWAGAWPRRMSCVILNRQKPTT